LRPCAAFDQDRYRAANPELGDWLDHPLAHYLWIGRRHGLTLNRRRKLPPGQRVSVTPRRVSPPSAEGLSRAVNLIGPLDRLGGVGVSARGYLDGAVRSGFGPVGAFAQRRAYLAQSPIQEDWASPPPVPDAAINLVHMGPDTLPLMLAGPDGGVLSGRYNVAIWYWELPTLRPEWWDFMNLFHEFWAPSAFVARAIRQLTARPVRIIPPYLRQLSGYESRQGSPAAPHFVYCFDANSVVERKNPDLLLDAFMLSFPEPSSARLTLKVTHADNRGPELRRLHEAADRRPDIKIIDRQLSDAELHGLIASATAYVSPHRSEGLGLTVIEAMASGTPVIATPYGGVESLVKTATAWPLAFKLVELAEDYAPYPQGYVWAEPDLHSLAAALGEAASNKPAALARANSARVLAIDHFSSARLLGEVRAALDEAASTMGL
jgi:glycosyltransferase involved in cell wall biosynthesis